MEGYYRYPTLHKDVIVFVSEDDLWTVTASGGVARRLTANLGAISYPFFSPDGAMLAFTGREEGHHEVYTMPQSGGPVRRITYLGVTSNVIGWTPDGKILFSSDHAQPFDRIGVVYSVSPEGGLPTLYPVGPAVSISMTRGNRTVIGRNNNDPARWKRYRGGTAGDLWIDPDGTGVFRRLLQLRGNVARPMWIGERIYFLSDHEGVGNLYSCTPAGEDLRQHTFRRDYYVRFPNTDGKRIVYQCGADLFVYDPHSGRDHKVDIDYHSSRVQRQRKFIDASKYLETYAPHPRGHTVAVTVRGKSFTTGNFEGAVMGQNGEAAPTRSRLTRWLNDGERVIMVTDVDGVDALEIHHRLGEQNPIRLSGLDIGRPVALRVSPVSDQVVLSNHRNELIWIDLETRTLKICDHSIYGGIAGMDWSPDGRWIAYGLPITPYQTAIKLWDRATGQTHKITKPVLHDSNPAFDPEGKYLYFIGMREFNPVYDNMHFDLGFPKGTRPYLITLRADLPSPFIAVPRPLQESGRPDARGEEATAETQEESEPKRIPDEPPHPVEITVEGIESRVVAFPVPEGIYGQVAGIKGKAFYTSFPSEGAIQEDRPPWETGPQARGTLEVYDFKELRSEPLVTGLSDFQLSRDGSTLLYRAGNRLRALKAGSKPDPKGGQEPGRRSGFIDLGRLKVSIEPVVEWRQMAREAWRLQREYFWTEDMSQIDWERVWERYAPLIERVGTRGEFSDLMWEMQGELGTSHAYEFGGDYRPEPSYPQGFLGADLVYEPETGAYRIEHIIQGSSGESRADSPLRGPGINVKVGDRLRAVNGQKVGPGRLPQELLVHQADSEVVLAVEDVEGRVRNVTVKALRSEFPARYREWVEANRDYVHTATNGRIGYVHIPDMGARGYAEFHRLYLAEVAYDGLIVDVRYNRGGHVSQLLIEKLARKRVGYDVPRWGQPEPYPNYSVGGPIVAITNQWAGSDGDIFSHVFKLMKLGPLIGKRTWGGVIGIWPRNQLADGAITTQPEFSFWFQDVGWGVENYGTDPDIDIDIAPQDYVRGYDPQMEKAIEIVMEKLEAEPPYKPAFADRPNLSLP